MNPQLWQRLQAFVRFCIGRPLPNITEIESGGRESFRESFWSHSVMDITRQQLFIPSELRRYAGGEIVGEYIGELPLDRNDQNKSMESFPGFCFSDMYPHTFTNVPGEFIVGLRPDDHGKDCTHALRAVCCGVTSIPSLSIENNYPLIPHFFLIHPPANNYGFASGDFLFCRFEHWRSGGMIIGITFQDLEYCTFLVVGQVWFNRSHYSSKWHFTVHRSLLAGNEDIVRKTPPNYFLLEAFLDERRSHDFLGWACRRGNQGVMEEKRLVLHSFERK